jgi:hypothetical protein
MWDQTTVRPAPEDDPEVVRIANAYDRRPERWRGSLVVGVLDGRPVAIAHLPRRSIWPFVLSVGFLIIFTSALLEHGLIAMTGAAVIVVALAGWFWPVDTEKIAIDETGADRVGAERTAESPLPLAIGDRQANGYWGTAVFVAILATASVTFLAGYFYLGEGPSPLPDGFAPPPLAPPLFASIPALLALVATRWLTSSVDRRADGTRWIAAGATALAHIAFVWLGIESFRASGYRPSEHGFASAAFGVVGFGWLVSAGAAAMLLVGVAWAVLAPRDPRGRGVALNASLVSYFAAASWFVALAAVYLWPRIS